MWPILLLYYPHHNYHVTHDDEVEEVDDDDDTDDVDEVSDILNMTLLIMVHLNSRVMFNEYHMNKLIDTIPLSK